MFGSSGFSASAFSQSSPGPTVVLTGVSAKAAVPVAIEEHGGSITENSFAEAPFASESSVPFFITVNTEGSISVTGLQATAQTSGVVFDESVDLTGLAATAAVGTATASLPGVVAVTGVSATGVVGGNVAEFGGSLFGGLSFAEEPFAGLAEDANSTIDVTTSVNASVTGVEGTGTVGDVAIDAAANVPVTGLFATGEVDSVSVVGGANVSPTGVAATGAPGSVTVIEGSGVAVAVNSPRLQGRVGIVTPNAQIKVFLTGVAGTGETSGASVVSWNEIIVNQDPNWVEIAA